MSLFAASGRGPATHPLLDKTGKTTYADKTTYMAGLIAEKTATLHRRLVEIPLFFLGLTSRPGFQPKKAWLLCSFDPLVNFLLPHALLF